MSLLSVVLLVYAICVFITVFILFTSESAKVSLLEKFVFMVFSPVYIVALFFKALNYLVNQKINLKNK